MQEEKTAEEFSSYYRIYEKYGQDYGVEEILAGALSGKIMAEKQQMAVNGSAESDLYCCLCFMRHSERGIRLSEAGAHGKGAFRVLAPVYRTLQAEKRRNVSFLAAAERAGICSV